MADGSRQGVRTSTGAARRHEALQARVQYVIPAAAKPFSYEYEPPPGTPLRSATFSEYPVLIHDARRLEAPPSLDAQGFALRQQRTRVRDFYDAAEVEAVYYGEVERLLKSATGARSILIFDHTVRGEDSSTHNGTRIHEPVHRVHNDYTPESGLRRIHDLLPRRTAGRLLRHRALEVNVWRPIIGPLRSWPLAVCDASSTRPDDFVACDLYYRDRVGEIYYVKYRERHRWYYYPDMRPDEALLLKCFDSEPAHGGTGAHAAFEHPYTPADAPPRASIEVRAFAFFAS
jgi:hypothetical protein